MLHPALTLALTDKYIFILLMLSIGGVLLALYIIGNILKTLSRERTRREIAAYVAEGSIDSAQAQFLLKADQSELEKQIADSVAWGMLSSEKAVQLVRTLRNDEPDRSKTEPTP